MGLLILSAAAGAVNIIRAILKKHRGREWLLFWSMTAMMCYLLEQYRDVYKLVATQNWQLLLDTVPEANHLLGWLVFACLTLNAVSLALNLIKK